MTTHSIIEQFNERTTLIDQMLTAVEQQHHETNGSARNDEFQTVNAVGLLLVELESDAKRKGIFPRVESTLRTLWKRYEKLSRIPSREAIAWLQNLLTFDNLCVLDIDIAFRWKQARIEVVRLAVIDRDEQVLFHGALNQERSRMTPVWEELCALLTGRFILAPDLDLTQLLLSSTAEHYDLDAPILIGASFVGLCQEDVEPGCNVSGVMPGGGSISRSSLLDVPDAGQGAQTALDHARTMLRLIQRMAHGTRNAPDTLGTGSSVSR